MRNKQVTNNYIKGGMVSTPPAFEILYNGIKNGPRSSRFVGNWTLSVHIFSNSGWLAEKEGQGHPQLDPRKNYHHDEDSHEDEADEFQFLEPLPPFLSPGQRSPAAEEEVSGPFPRLPRG